MSSKHKRTGSNDFVSDPSLSTHSPSSTSSSKPASGNLNRHPLLTALKTPAQSDNHARSSSLHSVAGNPGFGLLGGHETGLLSPGSSWHLITEKVAPLFQGRGLKGSIDELNELVRFGFFRFWALRKHLAESGSASTRSDLQALIKTGVESLSIKLSAVASVIPPTEEGDVVYLTRLADTWSYFYCTTLVFLEAVFLPFLNSNDASFGDRSRERLDLRALSLRCFKDDLVWPLRLRLEGIHARLILEELCDRRHAFNEGKETLGRLIQMVCSLPI